jgi:hypothetical protein
MVQNGSKDAPFWILEKRRGGCWVRKLITRRTTDLFGDVIPLDIFRADWEPESRLPHAGSSVNRTRVDEGRREDV